MKRRLCVKNNCQIGIFEETTLSAAGEERKKKYIYIYIYIYMRKGPLLKKACKGKERREEGGERRLFIHI